ncbi:MAG: tyrosine--tRNA ligase, partial [Bacteroidales bacterium]|nr:tyrosine--tRNA ligase [Bacteroidales bacterium]
VLENGISFADLAAEKTEIFPSKGELRRTVKGGGVSLNKEKVNVAEVIIDKSQLINNKYILIQKGKKNYYLIKVD